MECPCAYRKPTAGVFLQQPSSDTRALPVRRRRALGTDKPWTTGTAPGVPGRAACLRQTLLHLLCVGKGWWLKNKSYYDIHNANPHMYMCIYKHTCSDCTPLIWICGLSLIRSLTPPLWPLPSWEVPGCCCPSTRQAKGSWANWLRHIWHRKFITIHNFISTTTLQYLFPGNNCLPQIHN